MKIPMTWLVLAAVIGPFAARADIPATTPSTHPAAADPATPRGALKACDQSLPAGGLKAARALYHAADAKERKAASAMAKADLASAKLAKLVREKFGNQAAEDAMHAMRQYTAADIDQAQEKIDGDKATVDWNDEREPLEMVKVDGKWFVSVSALIDDPESIDSMVETSETLAREMDRAAEEVQAGEYANFYLLERAIRQKMFRVLGDDE